MDSDTNGATPGGGHGRSRHSHRHRRRRLFGHRSRYYRERWLRILLIGGLTLLACWALIRLLELDEEGQRRRRSNPEISRPRPAEKTPYWLASTDSDDFRADC